MVKRKSLRETNKVENKKWKRERKNYQFDKSKEFRMKQLAASYLNFTLLLNICRFIEFVIIVSVVSNTLSNLKQSWSHKTKFGKND